ncbi:hypothetical protein [Oleomonas cavernae]|uniref:hypothetical protein n=1 Tax=Oleomonas cavernae TaxID=2320859 RepID=UPI0011C455D3|nr:hypothetical protein [Oleomonas cavernae]
MTQSLNRGIRRMLTLVRPGQQKTDTPVGMSVSLIGCGARNRRGCNSADDILVWFISPRPSPSDDDA